MSVEELDVRGLSVVLGSSSRWRRRVFAEHFPRLPFGVAAADIDETAVTAGYDDRAAADPRKLTLAIAHAKADAILPQLPARTLLITSDQVVVFDGRIREKPADKEECRRYLRGYKDHPAVTVCAIVVTNTAAGGQRVEGVDVARQHFKPLPDDVIDALIDKGNVMDCAGGFTVEDPLLAPYLGEREGTEDSIMGLPVQPLRNLLSEAARLT